jgi:hypothetical protein
MKLLRMLIPSLLLAASAGSVQAEDRYFVTLFAIQGVPNLPRTSHTFAVFTKAIGSGEPYRITQAQDQVISWMPASLTITTLKLAPVPGVNLDLAATLKWAKANGGSVTAWGPFETTAELYALASKQIERLTSGQISYIALDQRLRARGASNCIHAVSDADTTQDLLMTGTAYGEAATTMVLRHFNKWLIRSEQSHPWVADRWKLPKDEIRWSK